MGRTFKPKTCEKCNSSFIPRSSLDRQCKICRTHLCEFCKKQFVVRRTQASNNAKYCSRICLAKGRNTKILHTCGKCRKQFESSSANSKWCNACCTVLCQFCGDKIRVKPKEIKTTKYCSKECKRKSDMNYVWQEEDLEFIRQNYPFELSMKEIAEKYGTSVSGVNRIVAKLDIPKCPTDLRNQRGAIKRIKWTKCRVIEDIKKYYDKEERLNSHHIQKINGTLHNRACALFGNWQSAIEASGFEYDNVNLYTARKTWTRPDIIAEIQQLNRTGADLSASHVMDHYADLFNAARHEVTFQNETESEWEQAINASGIDYSTIRGQAWGSITLGQDQKTYPSRLEASVADVLLDLKLKGKIKNYLSQVPITDNRAWRCDFLVSKSTGKFIFIEVDGLGGSRKGSSHVEKMEYLKTSGLEYDVIRKPEEILTALFEKSERTRNIPTVKPRRFVELGERRYTDQDLIDEIKRVFEKIGRVPTQIEFTANSRMSAVTVSLRIGWNKALHQAGLHPLGSASNEILLADIQRVCELLSHTPSQREYKLNSQYPPSMVVRKFGSWSKAIQKAGFKPVTRTWDRELIIFQIQMLNTKVKRLTFSNLKLTGAKPLYYAAVKYFGTWKAAIETAGLDYKKHVIGWSNNYDSCLKCGQNNYKHASKGLCKSCYEHEKRKKTTAI